MKIVMETVTLTLTLTELSTKCLKVMVINGLNQSGIRRVIFLKVRFCLDC